MSYAVNDVLLLFHYVAILCIETSNFRIGQTKDDNIVIVRQLTSVPPWKRCFSFILTIATSLTSKIRRLSIDRKSYFDDKLLLSRPNALDIFYVTLFVIPPNIS